MDSSKRSPLSSIENVAEIPSSADIELQEVREPLLSNNSEPEHRPITVDETTPFPTNLDETDHDDTTIEFRPAVDSESNVQQRRRRRRSSSPGQRRNSNRKKNFKTRARDFWADLMPADDREARILPITLFSICVTVMILAIVIIILCYATVEHHEFAVTFNRFTGKMDLKHPYLPGVHLVLPWKRMVRFDKVARYLTFEDLDVFTTDQASVVFDVTVVYRIRPSQIEPIWLNFANEHEKVLRLVTENILRNHGNQFSIYDYRARREHVEYRLSRVLQQTLSGNCCPSCCEHHTCSKTIEPSCIRLAHCNDTNKACSNGYFVDIDAVYLYKVDLPEPVIERLHKLMLKPLFTEIAESQENASIVRIETERLRNEYLNKARDVLMSALAKGELVREKARANSEKIMLKELGSSETDLFNQLNIEQMVDKLSASFLLEMSHLGNLTQTVDIDALVTQCDESDKTKPINDLFDFVPAANVFDMTEFLTILDN